jgi:hypothetical protein
LVTGIDPGGGASSCLPSVVFSGTGSSVYAVVGSCLVAAETNDAGTADAAGESGGSGDAGVPDATIGGADASGPDAAIADSGGTDDGGPDGGSGDDAGDDGSGDGPESVIAFSTSDWKPVTLASSALAFSVDDTGTSAAIVLATGQLQIVPLAGGTPVAINDGIDGALGSDPSVYLSKNDAFVLYATSVGALTSSTTSASQPATLVPTGALDIDALSPSGGWVLVDNGVDPMLGVATGLTLAGTAAGATSTEFASPAAGLYGDAFTADSKYVLYLANVSADDQANSLGTLTAAAVASPGTPIKVSTSAGSSSATTFAPSVLQSGNLSNALTIAGSVTNLALTGSAIAFSNNFSGGSGLVGETDIQVVDLSTTKVATTVVKRADPAFAVSFDKKYLLYTITFGESTDGLYSVPVP